MPKIFIPLLAENMPKGPRIRLKTHRNPKYDFYTPAQNIDVWIFVLKTEIYCFGLG
jgi:hypothetical protein